MWASPSPLSPATSLLVCLVMACSPTPRLSVLPHAFSRTNQDLSLQAMRYKTPSMALLPCCLRLLWRHRRPLSVPVSRSPLSLLAASMRWMPMRMILEPMDLTGTTMEIDPCPETTCICPWTTHTGTLLSALAHAAVSPLGAGFQMPPPVNRSRMSMMMLSPS